MPYIQKRERKLYDPLIKEVVEKLLTKYPGENGIGCAAGDLNYIISSIIWKLFKKKQCYSNANTLLGVLNAVNLEFYRRQVVPYENVKKDSNGDI